MTKFAGRQAGGLAVREPPRARPSGAPSQAEIVLQALPDPVLVVDAARLVRFVNFAAQQFLDASESNLVGRPLAELLPADSPVFFLIDQVLRQGSSMGETDVSLETPRIGRRLVNITAGALGEPPDSVALCLHEVSIARRIDHQMAHRNAARSVSAMAAILAHEIKNPLSGIRGAAQLLEAGVAEPDRLLTRLICDEADRVVALVDRMEVFSDQRPIERMPVNIHTVLERVRRLAQSGFARHVRFIERYDPSLPPVLGHRDQLIQVFLNLVKNAAEAVSPDDGEIILTTGYQRGVSMVVPGLSGRVQLPLMVGIQDNGPGIPEDLTDHLFDPFVTTKKTGSGLGLALVAKIIGDHGGVIGFESQPRRTVFKVSLPVQLPYPGQPAGAEDEGQP